MRYLKAKFIIPILLIAGVAIYYGFFNEKEQEYITEVASRGNVEQIVSVNGAVKSPSIIELRFQQNGKIKDIFFDVGDNIFEGDKVAALEAKLLKIDVERAKAGLAIVEAELNLKYAGPSNEEIRVSQSKIKEGLINFKNAEEKYNDTLLSNAEKLKKAKLEVENSEIALDKAEDDYKSYLATGENSEQIAQTDLNNAYDDSQTIVNDSIDTIKDSINAADSVLAIDDTSADDEFQDFKGVKATTELNHAKSDYKQSKEKLNKLEEYYDGMKDSWTDEEIEELLNLSKEALLKTRELLINTYAVLEGTLTDYNFTKSELDALKSSISTEQNYVTDNLSYVENLIQRILSNKLEITSAELSSGLNEVSAEAALETAKVNLEIAKSNLEEVKVENTISENSAKRDINVKEVLLEQARANHAKLIASPRYVDVASLVAKVDQAKAEYKRTLKKIEDTQIISPVDGIVTKINADKGENIDTLTNAVVIITDQLQIEANVSETDITKIDVGDTVDITLDSFSLDEVFTGKVVTINPAETVVQGVIYYETTVIFEGDQDKIKSGMTANMDIHTGSREDVITISPQAIQYDNGTPYIYIFQNEEKIKREVETGLEGVDKIEIKSGLNEGQVVILYER